MNTSEVAKMLGVSPSTIQRWVKQLDLPMEKNDRGHYLFSEDNLDQFRMIQEQIQNGVLLQDITPDNRKKTRRGSVLHQDTESVLEKISTRISDLEVRLEAKADSVASYQLLQHRQDIEELQQQVATLLTRIEKLENEKKANTIAEKPLVLDAPTKPRRKFKKKNIVGSFFGF